MLEGLPPHNPTRVMRLATDERSARAMTDLIGEVFDPAETAVAAFESEAGTWLLEAYFAGDPDEAAIRDLIRPIVGDAAEAAVFEAIAVQDWVKASLDGLKPVSAGRFLVHGSHDRGAVRAHHVGIEIDAALAFGTGHHGTTLGCLLALSDELKRRRRPRHVLDIGTGTGILAVAAAKALKPGSPASTIVAGDIDAVAVAVAGANARLNGVARLIRYFVAPGVRHALTDRAGRFDLVFANILARPLIRLAPSVARVLAPHGTLVLSGLLSCDAAGVLAAYGAQGLRLERRNVRDGWATLLLRRGGAAPPAGKRTARAVPEGMAPRLPSGRSHHSGSLRALSKATCSRFDASAA
jgi:ribosomal protein L11 methyltransferase